MSAAIAAAAAGANTAAPAVAAATKPRKIKARPVHVRLHAEPTVVLVIPCDDVVQQPPKSVGTMYLCEAYGLPGGCPRGEDCVEVHASTLKATKFTFHEKAESWTDASDIPYPCFPAGETLAVAKPNAEDEMEMFAANHVLATRALEMARRPLSHCAHFLWKGFCTRGAECEFIHAVKLASAEDAADVSSESSTPMEVSLVESQRSSPAESPARTMASTVRRYRHDPYDRSWMSPVISRVPSMVRRNDPYRSPWMVPSAVASRTISRAEYSLSTEYDAVPANVARSSGSGSSTPASRASRRARTPELMTL